MTFHKPVMAIIHLLTLYASEWTCREENTPSEKGIELSWGARYNKFSIFFLITFWVVTYRHVQHTAFGILCSERVPSHWTGNTWLHVTEIVHWAPMVPILLRWHPFPFDMAAWTKRPFIGGHSERVYMQWPIEMEIFETIHWNMEIRNSSKHIRAHTHKISVALALGEEKWSSPLTLLPKHNSTPSIHETNWSQTKHTHTSLTYLVGLQPIIMSWYM